MQDVYHQVYGSTRAPRRSLKSPVPEKGTQYQVLGFRALGLGFRVPFKP